MEDSESQEDELLALESIYDGTFEYARDKESNLPYGQFTVHLQLPQPFSVLFSVKEEKKDYAVQFLPPLVLHFDLPVDYPSQSSPKFTLTAKWLDLPQISSVCQRLDEIAKENSGEVVLFHWFCFLQEETIDFLQIKPPLDLSNVVQSSTAISASSKSLSQDSDAKKEVSSTIDNTNDACISPNTVIQSASNIRKIDTRAVQDIGSTNQLLRVVLEHNQQHQERTFRTTFFSCEVCFSDKFGELCMRLVGCGHVFCKECMRGYFEVHIRDGSVSALTCPNDKCDAEALPTQVRDLVSDELYKRYERLLLQYSLDTMPDIMYCPRQMCGSAVIVETDTNTGSCPQCFFVFCTFCKKTYHGVSPCRIQASEMKRIREEFENGTSEQKRELEKRYGAAMLRNLIEDSLTTDWIAANSKRCPSCLTNIEKFDGCNKMTCTKCRTFFCWLCGAVLQKQNPYLHFNKLDSKCFNQLFTDVQVYGDGEEEEMVF